MIDWSIQCAGRRPRVIRRAALLLPQITDRRPRNTDHWPLITDHRPLAPHWSLITDHWLLVWLVVALLCLLPFEAHPATSTFRADSDYLIDTWETEDGLPEDSATAMVQTRDGYLWFGTFNGLVRFDGVKFTVFNRDNTPQLPSAGIISLHQDQRSWLWVSTLRGMAVLADNQWRTFGTNDGWAGNYVRTFAERRNGDLLLTTFDGKVLEFANGRLNQLPEPPGRPGQGYQGCVDELGQWWLAQFEFVGRWDGRSWVQMLAAPNVNSAVDKVVLTAARDGGMWLLMTNVLRKYHSGIEVSRVELAGRLVGLWSISEDSRSNLWICTTLDGIFQAPPAGEVRHWTRTNGLSGDSSRFVFEDRESNLWVGSSGGGLQRFKPRRIHSFEAEGRASQQVVSSVCASATGGVWVATSGQGLFRRTASGVTNVALPRGNVVTRLLESVLEDRLGRVWVGTYQRGLWLIEKEGTRMISDVDAGGDKVSTLFEDSRGRIWMAGGQAASVYDGGRFRVFGPPDGLPRGPISGYAEDNSGAIWLAHQDGVFRFEKDRFALIKDESGSPLRDITCLRGDASGAMWMGSNTRGLIRWREGHLASVGPAAGLPVSAIYSIIEDQHAIWWMASDAGVVRASLADLRAAADSPTAAIRCQILDTGDGLPGKDFSTGRQPTSTRDAAGWLWFAMSKGVAVIDPKKFSVNEKPPPTHIEEVSYFLPSSGAANGRQVQLRPPFPEKVSLPLGSRRLEIHYTGLSFVAPGRVQFKVKLGGGDDAWQKAGNRRVAYYYDLPPRDYVFQVRAANNDGVWNNNGASLAFAVQPFFWQTWWFRVASGLLLAATGSGAALGWNRTKRRQELAELDRAKKQSAVLAALSLRPAVINGDLDAAFRVLTAQVASVIEIQRVSVWLWDEAANQLRCANVHDNIAGKPPPQIMMQSARYPRWLEALQSERTIEVADVRRDLRTSDLAADYLTPLGISSMLAAPVRLHGRMAGVICFEHRGPVRKWHADELTFAGAVADQAGQTIANAERKQAEQAIEQQRNELAHLSRVTTVSTLSGSLAHELNQPLGIILSNAQAAQELLLQDPPVVTEVSEILSDIVAADRRAADIIQRLRSLLKRGEMSLQPLPLNDLIEEVLRLVHADLIGRGVTAICDLAPDLPPITGDRVQLQQLVLNLIVNAADAMAANPPGKRRLHLTTARHEHTVRASVRDEGSGLPAEVERLFQPFYTTKAHGLGMGLAICRTIIAVHQGRLWAEPHPERGAVFHFELPVAEPGRGSNQ